jgi:hypothetical protein
MQTTHGHPLVLKGCPPSFREHRDALKIPSPLGVKPIVELPATKGRLALGDRPLFQLGLTSTEKRADHQINKP